MRYFFIFVNFSVKRFLHKLWWSARMALNDCSFWSVVSENDDFSVCDYELKRNKAMTVLKNDRESRAYFGLGLRTSLWTILVNIRFTSLSVTRATCSASATYRAKKTVMKRRTRFECVRCGLWLLGWWYLQIRKIYLEEEKVERVVKSCPWLSSWAIFIRYKWNYSRLSQQQGKLQRLPCFPQLHSWYKWVFSSPCPCWCFVYDLYGPRPARQEGRKEIYAIQRRFHVASCKMALQNYR